MNIVRILAGAAIVMLGLSACNESILSVNMSDLGVKPDLYSDCSQRVNQILDSVTSANPGKNIVFEFAQGRYDFYPENSSVREYYISNHDQDNPKYVGICMENLKNVTIDGSGSKFIFHGGMLPVSMVKSENCNLKNFSIDFEKPRISQVTVISNDTVNHMITYRPAPWVEYTIDNGTFIHHAEGWSGEPMCGIAFEPDTRRLVYRTSDIAVGTKDVEILPDSTLKAPWDNPRLIPGTVVAFRDYSRPCPAIFLDECKSTGIASVTVHYANGMGLLAQGCEDIDLDGFSVRLRGDSDLRYFTTQADATHFSGCKGMITSVNGFYENMMDDAINVHGTYLKIKERINDSTFVAGYMHHQAWGFKWGDVGDSVQFVASRTMEIVGEPVKIAGISPYDTQDVKGAKEFRIVFDKSVDVEINPDSSTFGIENLTWTPEVYFAGNTVRNNRARGALFSTPRHTVVENNLFDHTSGTAILLCGDCNGWFETGACRNILITQNRFINALTNMFQFTNAVISIYPEIPDLENQKKYFHGGIVITDNEFDTFDAPLLYAKSVDGLVFENNIIKRNTEYPAFHPIQQPVKLERVINARIQDIEQ
ncbi:MAG: alpha-1,3-galactosidase B [Paramuribaculum sp.]|nr:alpha-1,3-galactosidase B [Paramuribaculum sp.]